MSFRMQIVITTQYYGYQDLLDNNQQANEKYSKAFSDFFQQKLNVPPKRGYITFIDSGRGNMGYAIRFLDGWPTFLTLSIRYDGTTFATILG